MRYFENGTCGYTIDHMMNILHDNIESEKTYIKSDLDKDWYVCILSRVENLIELKSLEAKLKKFFENNTVHSTEIERVQLD